MRSRSIVRWALGGMVSILFVCAIRTAFHREQPRGLPSPLSGQAIGGFSTCRNTTIAAGRGPIAFASVGTKVYMANNPAGSPHNLVRVIDTLTDNVTRAIEVGTSPMEFAVVGTKLYVANLGDTTLSVIDTTTDSLIRTITVGSNPTAPTAVGTKLYVAVRGSNKGVAVINTATDSVTKTIPLESSPVDIAAVGTSIYVLQNNPRNIVLASTPNLGHVPRNEEMCRCVA